MPNKLPSQWEDPQFPLIYYIQLSEVIANYLRLQKLDVKVAVTMTNLEKNAETTSERYSNLDMLTLLDKEMDGWQRDNVDIFLRPHGMSAEFMLRNKQDAEAQVKYFQTDDFRPACTTPWKLPLRILSTYRCRILSRLTEPIVEDSRSDQARNCRIVHQTHRIVGVLQRIPSRRAMCLGEIKVSQWFVRQVDPEFV